MSTVPAEAGQTVTPVRPPFWDGLHEGRPLLQRCAPRGRAPHHPAALCRWSSELSRTESAATGTVGSWTVVPAAEGRTA